MTNIRAISTKPSVFKDTGYAVRVESPGRINLIGEHTDYNEGFVMPTAIDKRIILRFQKNETDNYCRVYSETFGKGFEFHLDKAFTKAEGWENYILGVVKELQDNGAKLEGFDCIIESKLPLGAGISSSAALECGLASGLNALFDLGLEDLEIVKLSQKAENDFVGSNCGIMDQYSSVMSKPDHIILLDCRDLKAEFIPADFRNCKLLLLNTNVSHSIADSDYNSRRAECEAAVEIIQKELPEIRSVRDLNFEILDQFKDKLKAKMYERCLYVLKENERVLKAAETLKSGSLKEFGELMYGSHEGLQHNYEVSCKELDFLVDYSRDKDFIYGSRMMGGGFGGCTINLIEEDKIDEYIDEVSAAYFAKFNIKLDAIIVQPDEGTKIFKE
ncbi:galactokinase [Christiangramia sp. SM2212]|uniref:Galactokinase n=1 Tax=Christiangramia sediminicola TaxID=3073267 RepID=A0ABU1EQM2_9FLAO|nr:galactokinase [Christiangramia sp. SM2212]MDR5590689.1 galactokinase [Christiangramia sp. SM2212]